MSKRKFAFSLGFCVLAISTMAYLVMIGITLYVTLTHNGNGLFEGAVIATLIYLLPALLVAFALRVGQHNPVLAGLIELVVGTILAILGSNLLYTELSFGWDNLWSSSYGLAKPGVIFTILGSGLLLQASGILFLLLNRALSGPHNSLTGA